MIAVNDIPPHPPHARPARESGEHGNGVAFDTLLRRASRRSRDAHALLNPRLVQVMADAILARLARMDDGVLPAGSHAAFLASLHAADAPHPTRPAAFSAPGRPQGSPAPFTAIIEKAAGTYQLDPELIKAVIHVESGFDPNAVSAAGAMGLMQLMPETAKDMRVRNPFDPEQNIMGGSRYLKHLLQRYHGRTDLALAAYNWGMGNLERHAGRIPEETARYVAKIGALLSRA